MITVSSRSKLATRSVIWIELNHIFRKFLVFAANRVLPQLFYM